MPGHDDHGQWAPLLVANLNALALDYLARQKVQGQHLNSYIIEQLPVVPSAGFADRFGTATAEDIGGGRYVAYAHLKPGSIPAWVRPGARVGPGDLIGRVGNSGNSQAPHLHFQVMDAPSFFDATGLPFVFDAQLLEGTVSEAEAQASLQGAAMHIDRRGAGVRRGLMPARNGVFGYNLSSQ